MLKLAHEAVRFIEGFFAYLPCIGVTIPMNLLVIYYFIQRSAMIAPLPQAKMRGAGENSSVC